MATQKERILAMLEGGVVCGSELLDARMPRYAARILELKADGYHIITMGLCPEHKTARYIRAFPDSRACTLLCQCKCDSCVIFGAHQGQGHDTLEGPVR